MSMDDAIAEAYASAPTKAIILPCLELRHPSFLNEDGVITPIRLVRDNGQLLDDTVDPEIYGWMFTLEGDAPADPGETVLFQSCMFDFDVPGQDQNKLPDLNISIDNVARIVSKYTDNAVKERNTVGVTYREYLFTDTSHPGFLLTGLTLNRVKSTVTGVTGTASFKDLINKSFPGYLYRRTEFKGLSGTPQ